MWKTIVPAAARPSNERKMIAELLFLGQNISTINAKMPAPATSRAGISMSQSIVGGAGYPFGVIGR